MKIIRKHKRSSEKLLEITNVIEQAESVRLDTIIKMFGERAFGIVLLFLSLPSALPFSAIPGVAFLFSLPILIFSCQMVLGRKTLWLPKVIARKEINCNKIIKIINTTVPYLKKIEYFLKPRLSFFTSRIIDIINGLIIFGLAFLLMLPIPFSNFIIASLLIIFSFGLIEQDGLFIIIAYIAVTIYLSFTSFFIITAINHISKWLH